MWFSTDLLLWHFLQVGQTFHFRAVDFVEYGTSAALGFHSPHRPQVRPDSPSGGFTLWGAPAAMAGPSSSPASDS
jgi:hypothetical protein